MRFTGFFSLIFYVHMVTNSTTSKKKHTNRKIMYCSLSNNFAFLAMLRSITTLKWVQNSSYEISSLASTAIVVAISFNVVSQCLIKFGLRNHSSKIFLAIFIVLCVQFLVFLSLSVTYIIKFPPSKTIFTPGGVASLWSGTIALFVSLVLSSIYIYNYDDDVNTSLEELTYELSNSLFVWYIVFGGTVFTALEPWDFERATEFCLMTLLTIGYL